MQDSICIIADILRTSNTILTALKNGFEKVKPILAMEKTNQHQALSTKCQR
ncbi:2-phosphosulfolactate phosphatase [Coxiella endosymbiont of Ornithodoros maritimus]|uniref:2-phosphosulfolactate phosphatase n=1 Tax=Coxiella endosymbiont of Ornithodoros maritimus TaxID=1656172 RepID=UPI002263D0D5|nr:2-phosphosulfolactate phosphatase [Coxiella endosymbiont of Ornithodoros maritimus]